jgi:hypothetical protein
VVKQFIKRIHISPKMAGRTPTSEKPCGRPKKAMPRYSLRMFAKVYKKVEVRFYFSEEER